MDKVKVAAATQSLMQELELSLDDENFKDTPERVARMYEEICYSESKRRELIDKVLSKTFPSKYNGMVVEKGVRVYSLCGHHLLPMILDVVIGYIPKKRVLGLSKLARLADILAKRPLIQEDYTKELTEEMMLVLKPEGVGVFVSGLHFCQTMRGIKQRNAIMTTVSLEGSFLQASVKQEFLEHCRNGGNYAL